MSSQIIKQGKGFATYPSVKLFNYKTDKKTKKIKFAFIKELLFGDEIKPEIKNNNFVQLIKNGKTYIKVNGRNANGYILSDEIQPERILEVNFIDVGQGDCCHIVTPDDKHFIVDAGKTDNMFRFLKWRFNLKESKNTPPPFTALITHSDDDHYKGFNHLFKKHPELKQQFKFNAVYHNGMIETSGSKIESLGKVSANKDYIIGLINTNKQYNNFVKGVAKPGMYIKTLNKTTAPKKALRFGVPPIYNKGKLKIEVIAPATKKIGSRHALPVFASNKGKTKNGNSVVLHLSMNNIKILLGGDLNSLSEDYLLGYYSGLNVSDIKKKLKSKDFTADQKKVLKTSLLKAINRSKKYLEVDIAKSSHHGSSDFTSDFLKAINPLATIISSGDEEPHCHPRPDALGTIGKYSRGERSLIFSTELARSSKEFIKLTGAKTRDKKTKTVTKYGMINIRTDGEKVIIAQKLERRAGQKDWDIHKLNWNAKKSQFEYKQYLK